MQRSGVKIRTVRPNQSVRVSVYFDPPKQLQIAQRSEEFARQNRSKIDRLLCLIVELDAQRIIGNNLESDHSVDRVCHETLPQWRDGHRSSTLL